MKKKFIINNMENKKVRQYRSNQGRSPRKENETMLLLFLVGKILLLIAIGGLLLEMFIW